MTTFEYTIRDELGIHARPAGLLVKAAGKYPCSVFFLKGEKKAEGKRIFAVMGLGVKCGDSIQVLTDGKGEQAAAKEIEEILRTYL